MLRAEKDFGKAAKPEFVLTSGKDWAETYMAKHYAPLVMCPTLFRTFADLRFEDRDAILAFANEYGDLGIDRTLTLAHPDNPNNLLGVTGEPWQEWAVQISEMREAVSLWDLLRSRDGPGLSRFLRWEPAGRGSDGVERPHAGWMYSSHPDVPRNVFLTPQRRFEAIIPKYQQVEITEADILTPASVLIQGWVNRHLERKAMPRLLHHRGLGTMVLMIVPSSLLSAMWLQLAHAIAGNKDYRACRECGNWFEVSRAEDARTARRMFCSDACKSRDYRRRRDEESSKKALKQRRKK